jgi:hypothetical protein
MAAETVLGEDRANPRFEELRVLGCGVPRSTTGWRLDGLIAGCRDGRGQAQSGRDKQKDPHAR